MPDLIGHTLGQYRIVEHIGLGGMATVYKAYQPALDRYVAVKILPAYYAHEPGFAERFVREAKAVAKLTHPHVLPIYDFGQQDDLSYIVMQFVDAGTLKDMLGRPISLAMAADIVEQIAEALDYAHERGIIHRDVKPSNVLMDRGQWVLLSDFGLAKMVEGSIQLTGSGVGVGTPAYMAPEQGQGLKVDRRADIYSLGIILYEMVTGGVPYSAETPMAVVVKHITEPLPLPHDVNPDVPEEVERVILKALAKTPDDRYETAGKMAAALRKVVAGLDTAIAEAVPAPAPSGIIGAPVAAPTILEEGGATQVVPAPVETPPPQPAKKRRVPIWAIAVAGVMALVTLWGFCALAGRAGKEREAKATQTALAQAATAVPSASLPVETPATPPAGKTPAPAAPTEPSAGEAPSPPVAGDLAARVKDFIKQNPPVFEDDFADPKSGWRVADDGQGQSAYENGSYLMVVPEVVGKESNLGVQVPFDKPPANLALQLDLTLVKGGLGAGWSAGIRQQPDVSHVGVALSAQPRGFGIYYLGSPSMERTLARGPLIRDYRPGQPTQVLVVAMGQEISLFLDGQRVGAARTDLVKPGRLFFSVTNNGDPSVAYRIDNVRVWDLESLASQPPDNPPGQQTGLPISEDFANADRWDLGPGWKLVQDETGNPVLEGESHNQAVYRGGNWRDIHLRFRTRRMAGDDNHINFRVDLSASNDTRYLVHLMSQAIVLHRIVNGRGGDPQLAGAPIANPPNEWRTVDIFARGGHIEIALDGQTVIKVDDPNPLGPGTVTFENGDPPVRNQVDDVLIEPAGP
jgi:hypothetical protein